MLVPFIVCFISVSIICRTPFKVNIIAIIAILTVTFQQLHYSLIYHICAVADPVLELRGGGLDLLALSAIFPSVMSSSPRSATDVRHFRAILFLFSPQLSRIYVRLHCNEGCHRARTRTLVFICCPNITTLWKLAFLRNTQEFGSTVFATPRLLKVLMNFPALLQIKID